MVVAELNGLACNVTAWRVIRVVDFFALESATNRAFSPLSPAPPELEANSPKSVLLSSSIGGPSSARRNLTGDRTCDRAGVLTSLLGVIWVQQSIAWPTLGTATALDGAENGPTI
jgi:hypothetical protein